MKKLLFLGVLFQLISIQAQQLDESFLDSLPDDIREDLVKRADGQAKTSEEMYRPSQYSSKLQRAEELLNLKTRLEADLLELEQRLQSDEVLKIRTDLEIFGKDFFSSFQTSFMPINEPNPDSTYSLDVGDVVNIQLTGQIDLIEDIPISGDGAINISDIGKIVLAGLTLGEASDLVKARVSSAFFGTEAFISLAELRDVNVLVTGNAANPGIYTLSGNSNVLQALSVAGGVNEQGSYREINLVRKNKVIESLDMYDLLIKGNYNLKERLRSGDVVFEPDEIFKQYSNEGDLYLSDDFEVTDLLKIHAGLRYSSFQHNGYISFRDYIKNDLTGNKDNYRHIEPRLSIRYKLSPTSSLKAAYTQNYQYIHLASTSSVSLPTDLWVPSSSAIEPKFADQYALGYFRNLNDNMYETSVEAYYKEMSNLIEYKEGELPEDNTNSSSDDSFTFGNGDSYGVEFLIKKTKGRTTGWIGYTLSKTTRYFNDVNNGEAFPAKYDRRHDLSITATHKLSDKWSVSSVFVYATGNSITLPTERYLIGDNIYTEYTSRNGFRMEPYHRLDLSATYTPKKRKKYQSSWNFSIYNLYSRKNPYFIYFALEGQGQDGEGNIQEGNLTPKAYQVSIFPILPSITWNFNF